MPIMRTKYKSDDYRYNDVHHQRTSRNFKPHKKSARTMRTNAPPTVKTVISGNPSIMGCEMSCQHAPYKALEDFDKRLFLSG